MLALELETWRIPDIYRRFAEEVGDAHWRKRVHKLTAEIRGNRFLESMLREENAIAFQLERLRQVTSNLWEPPQYDRREFYSAAAFAAQTLSAMDATDRKTAERIRRRVHGALQNPDDMRAMRLEMTAATHFLRRGCSVSWPELTGVDEKAKSFDLLVGVGAHSLEVECKSISSQKGARITKRQTLEFYEQVRKRHRNRIHQLTSGVVSVITLPSDLPHAHRSRLELADAVAEASMVAGPGSYTSNGADIRVESFNAAVLDELADGVDRSRARELLDSVSKTFNKEVFVAGRRGRGALVLVVQSERDNGLMNGLFSVLKTSAASQFSQKNPAMFVVGLDGIADRELLELAYQDDDPKAVPTALRWHVSEFLNSSSRSHLVGVAFLGAGGVRPLDDMQSDTGGTAYHFWKDDSQLWSEEFRGLFRPSK